MDLIMDELVMRYPALECCVDKIQSAGDLLIRTYSSNHKLLVCGNGGSGADSEHIVGELMKEFTAKRPLSVESKQTLMHIDSNYGQVLAKYLQGALPTITLTSNVSLSTAFSNDVHPQLIFAQQVWGYGLPGDILLAITTSGNSQNVIYAAVTAKAKQMKVIGLTGENKSAIDQYSDICIKVPSSITYRIQEYHLPIYHALCRYVEKFMFLQISSL